MTVAIIDLIILFLENTILIIKTELITYTNKLTLFLSTPHTIPNIKIIICFNIKLKLNSIFLSVIL